MFRKPITHSLIRPLLLLSPIPLRPFLHKTFTTTPPHHKKHPPAPSQKPSKAHAYGDNTQDKTSSLPFDYSAHFASLEEHCNTHITKLKSDIVKLRAGGRNEPGVLEGLQVTLDKSTGATASLRDIAHVLARGRILVVSVYEAANVKHVIAAIQKADLNVQPMPDPKNAQLINVPLPPPTKETRMQVAEMVGKAGDKTMNLLRLARQDSHKLLKGLKKERPDDIRKADKQLEVVMKKVNAEAKKVVEDAKKGALEN
ncbi:ribosome recycling factor [Choiromyces venosus 120613-1]|uniref:Ribosome recycling factor n=1 Tax=Choiromyces venosus 120613-1 TaxID=1336337 RepID=A0A3N4IU92_9PEZI|nr:ribosome recycling factor [Choiromyces venosus 120613-1]